MVILLIHYLAIYNNEHMNEALVKIAKDFKMLAKSVKFRQIWSHCHVDTSLQKCLMESTSEISSVLFKIVCARNFSVTRCANFEKSWRHILLQNYVKYWATYCAILKTTYHL